MFVYLYNLTPFIEHRLDPSLGSSFCAVHLCTPLGHGPMPILLKISQISVRYIGRAIYRSTSSHEYCDVTHNAWPQIHNISNHVCKKKKTYTLTLSMMLTPYDTIVYGALILNLMINRLLQCSTSQLVSICHSLVDENKTYIKTRAHQVA